MGKGGDCDFSVFNILPLTSLSGDKLEVKTALCPIPFNRKSPLVEDLKINHPFPYVGEPLLQMTGKGARWHSGRKSDSESRGPGFDPHKRHRVVSLSKAH